MKPPGPRAPAGAVQPSCAEAPAVIGQARQAAPRRHCVTRRTLTRRSVQGSGPQALKGSPWCAGRVSLRGFGIVVHPIGVSYRRIRIGRPFGAAQRHQVAVTAGLHRLCHGRGPCLAALGDQAERGRRLPRANRARRPSTAHAGRLRRGTPLNGRPINGSGSPGSRRRSFARVRASEYWAPAAPDSCAPAPSAARSAPGRVVVPLRRSGALVGALRGAGGSNRSSCTGVGGHGRRLRAGRRVGANGRAPRRVSLRSPSTIRTTCQGDQPSHHYRYQREVSAMFGGLSRLRSGAWPLVRRQFALQSSARLACRAR